MSGFDDRKRGEEGKFAHDQEFRFKATARRDKLVGLWVAETFLDLSGDDADAFAKEVVASNFEKPGDDDMIEYVLGRVEGTSADLSRHRLESKMAELMKTAEDQIQSEAS